MSEQTYRVLRSLVTDVDGKPSVACEPGDCIHIDDEARATYLIDAGFISKPGAAAPQRANPAATSDAPDPADLDLGDGDTDPGDADDLDGDGAEASDDEGDADAEAEAEPEVEAEAEEPATRAPRRSRGKS